jgi:hypothetical protein
MGQTNDKLWREFSHGQDIILSSAPSRPAMGHTQPHILWVLWAGAHPKASALPPSPETKFKKNTYFVDTVVLSLLRGVSLSFNHQLKSAGA